MINTLKKFDYDREQIEKLLKSKLPTFGGNLLLPIIFFYMYKNIIPLNILLTWLILQIIVFIVRITIMSKTLKVVNSIDQTRLYKNIKLFLITLFLNSFLWGISTIFIIKYSSNVVDAYIMFIILIGMGTAAASTLSAVYHAQFIFITNIILVPTFIFIFLGNSSTYYLLAVFGVIYYVFTIVTSFSNFVYIRNNIKQRKELQKRNDNFKNLLDITMETIVMSDSEHKIIDINSSGIKLFKANDKTDALGRSIIDFVPKHSLPIMFNAMTHDIQEPYELDLIKIDGEQFPSLISSRNLIIDGKKVRIATILDLTQVKQKDKQLQQQSRLAQMGEMISMIAHQWRQPLGAINSSVIAIESKLSIGRYDLDDKDDREKFFKFLHKKHKSIIEYVEGLSETIDDFRNFFKPDKNRDLVCIDDPIKKALKIVNVSMSSKGISIEKSFDNGDKIELYQNEVMQVILNILKNAEDNFIEKSIENPTIMIETLKEKNTHIIKISDNGGGIPENILPNIFDPYFSTKDEKNGTGLGLYMSKTVIEEHHNGELKVSNIDNGVCFEIKFFQYKEDI